MQSAGYATAICGKWHLGDRADTTDIPHHHGFDYAYCIGYPYPDRGWEHWPSHVFVNGRQTAIPGNGGGRKARYMDDLYTDAAIEYMKRKRGEPFLVFLSFQGVHAPMDGAISPRYAERDWPEVEKIFASMLERVDANVGRVMAALRELGIERSTVVFFTSDNGPHREGGHDPEFFDSRGGLRGIKRDLYEGGVRVPLIVRWPGVIPAGGESNHLSAHWDMLATFAELGGVHQVPESDGISFMPTLRGGRQREHAYLYWETGEQTGSQAVRVGRWKGVRIGIKADAAAPFQLYDLESDPAEQHDLAAKHPDVVRQLAQIAVEARVPSPHVALFPHEDPTVKVGPAFLAQPREQAGTPH
jgi:arylsulfatase A